MKKQVFFLFLTVTLLSGIAWAQDRPDALEKYRNGQYEEAVSICLNELEQMPRNMDSYTVLGWSLVRLGRYREALEYGRLALQISRYDHRIIQNMGEAHYYLGNYLEALRYFEEYASLAPSGARINLVYYFMGEIFISLEEYHHSDIAFTTALYHSPNNAGWWQRTGYAREMAGNYSGAKTAYEKALSLNPSLQDASRGIARVEARL